MLSDIIQYFNNLSGGDEKHLNTMMTFATQYMNNTLPPLTCLYGSLHTIFELVYVLDDLPNQFRQLTNDVLECINNNNPIIVGINTLSCDVDQSLLKHILTSFGNKIIIVSMDKCLFDSDTINLCAHHIYFPDCFELPIGEYIDELDYDMIVDHNQAMRQSILILHLFFLWRKLQYINHFLIHDVMKYIILLYHDLQTRLLKLK